MKPWAKWLINRNMRWVLYAMGAMAVPVVLALDLWAAGVESFHDICDEFKNLSKYKREPK